MLYQGEFKYRGMWFFGIFPYFPGTLCCRGNHGSGLGLVASCEPADSANDFPDHCVEFSLEI